MEIKHAKGKPKNEDQVKGPDHKENHAGPSLKDGDDALKGMSTTGTDKPNVASDSTNLAVDMIEVLASANQDGLKEVTDSALGLTSLITGVDSVQESGTMEEGIVPVGSMEDAIVESGGEDEQLVDAVPTSDRGNESRPPVVVGEIVSPAVLGQQPDNVP